MKVLIATPYIFKKEWPEFTKNRTGFGLMVNDIFESVAENHETYLLSQVITKGHGNVLKHTWRDIFVNARLEDWGKAIRYFIEYKQGLRNRLKYSYYALNTGSIRKTIRTIKPDLVHIHGISMQIKPFIDVCKKENVPYIVTLHGLIGLDESVNVASWDKQIEKAFLIEADKECVPVTVISTGMKRRIEENYLGHEASNITVICNGTRIPYDERTIALDEIDLRKQYGLNDEKIVVVIGSVCERKNQIQVIEALKSVKTPCHVFFCGADDTNGYVQNIVNELGIRNRIHFLGFLTREMVEQVLDQADLNVVASRDEGFGLSIIEAYTHGVPTVTFSDLDIIPGLINEKATIKVDKRDGISLAKGIEKGLNKQWDNNWIKVYAKTFSLEEIAERYRVEYQNTLSEGGYTSIAKTCDFLAIKRMLGYRVFAYIGNITENKNQIELVKIMPNLKDEKIIAILAGREVDDGQVRQYIIENRIENVILAGFCSEMDSIWCNIDLNVFLSKNDGFGLSIIEGYLRGVPSVMYDDLDAVEDLRIEGLYAISRDSKALYNSLLEIKDKWNSKIILQQASRFSIEQMSANYVMLYKKTMGQ